LPTPSSCQLNNSTAKHEVSRHLRCIHFRNPERVSLSYPVNTSRIDFDEDQGQGVAVDTGTGTQKQRRAMVDLVERRIRLRAHQLYEERGHVGAFALEDWLQAESEVLKTSILAPLYRRSRNGDQASLEFESDRCVSQ